MKNGPYEWDSQTLLTIDQMSDTVYPYIFNTHSSFFFSLVIHTPEKEKIQNC